MTMNVKFGAWTNHITIWLLGQVIGVGVWLHIGRWLSAISRLGVHDLGWSSFEELLGMVGEFGDAENAYLTTA